MSQRSEMTVLVEEGATPSSLRPELILDAAERCFVREGFHRTTMQAVAGEAGMSAGNLYRYFSSKDALIEGLVERDRAKVARCFSEVAESSDLLAGLRDLGVKHYKEEPREQAVLTLQIWAEAARSERLAGITADFERDLVKQMQAVVATVVANAPGRRPVDAKAVALLIATLSSGLFVRRAIAPDFDPDREVDVVLCLIGALIKGDIDIPGIGRTMEQTS